MATSTIINPWTWGDAFGFVQGVDTKNPTRIIHCAGQGDQSNEDGSPRNAGDMPAQIAGAMDNVERVLSEASLSLSDVTRINYYTTDVDACIAALRGQQKKRLDDAQCRASSTLIGVTRLAFPEMLVEIEVTAVA
jgi:enamine deaminase RidA (YjgF/YER057c/UK114 family)